MYEMLDMLTPLTSQLEALEKIIGHWKQKEKEQQDEKGNGKAVVPAAAEKI